VVERALGLPSRPSVSPVSLTYKERGRLVKGFVKRVHDLQRYRVALPDPPEVGSGWGVTPGA